MDKMIKEKLIALSEEEYRKFNSMLTPNVDNMLGVRLPLLRKLAKEIARGDWRAFLAAADDEYFEETMLQGIVIGYAKADTEEMLQYVSRFIPKINNWAVCDTFCTGLKFTKQNKARVWEFLMPYFASETEYEVRFGVIMLLLYFIDEEYIARVLQHLDSVRHVGYYARMAVAWAVSMCFVGQPDPTMLYLKQNSLDDFTYHKTLQKITESHQVDDETKDIIRSMKRK
jgi:3-methyladenine DNA glycosylase AlkD